MAATWLYNAGRPCCAETPPNCGVNCNSCNNHTGNAPKFATTGNIYDDNGVHVLKYHPDYRFWYTELIEFETDHLGRRSETGVWNWVAVQGGAEPRYKQSSGLSYYRYIFRCNSFIDMTTDSDFFLAMTWWEGVAYGSQADADAGASGVAVFLDGRDLILDDVLDLPASFPAGSSGKNLYSGTDPSGSCIDLIFSDVTGPPGPGPITAQAHVVIAQVVDPVHCCGVWCSSCNRDLLQYGSVSDANGTHILRLSGITGPMQIEGYMSEPVFFTSDKVLASTSPFYRSGIAAYYYAFYCRPATNDYWLWIMWTLWHGQILGSGLDVMGFPGGSWSSLEILQMAAIAVKSSAASCDPLSLSFDFAYDQYFVKYDPTSPTQIGPFIGDDSNYRFYSQIGNSADPHHAAFPVYHPSAGSATVLVGAYKPTGSTICGDVGVGSAHPFPARKMTLSWVNSAIGNGTATLTYRDGEWFGAGCYDVGRPVPVGYADAGEPAMVMFGFKPRPIGGPSGFRVTILKQGPCPARGDYPSNDGGLYNLFVPLSIIGDASDNKIVDFFLNPVSIHWTPNNSSTPDTNPAQLAARQFLLECGFTGFTITE